VARQRFLSALETQYFTKQFVLNLIYSLQNQFNMSQITLPSSRRPAAVTAHPRVLPSSPQQIHQGQGNVTKSQGNVTKVESTSTKNIRLDLETVHSIVGQVG
jgi:hypothetical protein